MAKDDLPSIGGIPKDIDAGEEKLSEHYHPNAAVDRGAVNLPSLVDEMKDLGPNKGTSPSLEKMFGKEEDDFHQSPSRIFRFKRKKKEGLDDLPAEPAIRYFHQGPVFRYVTLGLLGIAALAVAVTELSKRRVKPLERLEVNQTIQTPLERVTVTEYVDIPCDDDPECFAQKLRASELEARLSSPAPVEKVLVPIYEKVEIPCEDNPECLGYKQALFDLQAKLEAPAAPKKAATLKVEALKVSVSPAIQTNMHQPTTAPDSRSWYERFQTFDKQEFKTAFFAYVNFLGKERAVIEAGRETLFYSFAHNKLGTPEYDYQKRLFNERVFQYLGTSSEEVVSCIKEPKRCN